MKPLTPRLLAIVGMATLSLRAYADVLITKSGETLQGTLVKETPDSIIFQSRTFGELTVPREAVQSVDRAPEAAAARQATPAAEAPAGKPPTSPAPEPEAGEAETPVGRFFARINPLKGWKSNFALGFTARRGEDSDNNLNIRFRSERKTDDDQEHLIEARILYAEDVLQNNVRDTTDELMTASYQYRHGLTAPFFFQSNSQYYRDVIKDLDHEVTQTVGIGARFKRESWSGALTPSVGVRYRNISGDNTWQAVIGAYQNLEYAITETLKLRETLYYLTAVEDLNDSSTRLGLEVNQKIGSIWSIGLRYDYTYDAVVGTTADRVQQRWALTIGLDF